MAKERRGASLRPSDAASGIMLDDVDVTLENLRFTDEPPQGYQHGSLFLEVSFSGKDIENTSQHYSAGSLDRFIPSDDGLRAVPADEDDYEEDGSPSISLVKSTNAILFLKSIVDNGFDEEKIGDEVDVFEGINVHLRQVPQPKRSGLDSDDKKPGLILLVTKINALAGEKKAKGKGKARKAKPVEVSGDVTEKATDTVIAAVAASENGLKKKELLVEIFKALAKDDDRTAVVQLVKSDEFLESGPWTYEDGDLS